MVARWRILQPVASSGKLYVLNKSNQNSPLVFDLFTNLASDSADQIFELNVNSFCDFLV